MKAILLILVLLSASILLFGCTQTNQSPSYAQSTNQTQNTYFEIGNWIKSPVSDANLEIKYAGSQVIAEYYILSAEYYQRPTGYLSLDFHKTIFNDKANLQKWLDTLKSRFPETFVEVAPNQYYLTYPSWGNAVKVLEQDNETLYAVDADDISSGLANCGSDGRDFCVNVALKAIGQVKQK